MRRIDFVPAKHGFHFTNLFVNNVAPGITTYGLCGGMALAAARYWMNGVPVPTHVASDFPDGSPAGVPPPGSTLHGYIYGCQMESFGPLGVVSAANWVTMPWITLRNQFDWSVAEFSSVRQSIDAGVPVVVGLRRVVGGPMGHQVLAYGYDESDLRVFVYDSNYPDQEKCLRLDPNTATIAYDGAGSPQWSSYFITGCAMRGPRPDYLDLGLQQGLTVRATEPVQAGTRVDIDVTVRNFGFRDAHVQGMVVSVRGPGGENLDALLGGTDQNSAPIPPGGERRIVRAATQFGSTPGPHTISIAYRSLQGQVVLVPPVAAGTRNQAAVSLAPVMPWQSDWRWCHRCQGLFYSGGQSSNGSCPSGGQHQKTVSGNYTLAHNQAETAARQSDWRWCHKCQGLFFAGRQSSNGSCPSGGQHEKTGSGNYALVHNQPAAPDHQADWRWCGKCQGLFFAAGQPVHGRCPAGGAHENVGSGNYALKHEAALTVQPA